MCTIASCLLARAHGAHCSDVGYTQPDPALYLLQGMDQLCVQL